MAPPGEEALYGEELRPGALVGPWVVVAVHAAGPVSSLYRARHVQDGTPAALKVLHSHASLAPLALRRFRREAATLQRLRHPHIVEVRGHGTLADGRPFIAMEWLEGRDLAAELAQRGPLSPREALEVMEQVGSALREAHAAGVVHRDLKPQNVVRLAGSGESPRVKLVDFGVAKGLRPGAPGNSTLTHTGTAMGTPLSMAPEQVRGEVPDTRTDLYALGVLLFQLVTGQPPFPGPTRHEVEEQHLHAPPPRPSERAPVPAALDAVVLRCLRKRREERYPDVDALMEDLRGAVRGTSARDAPEHAVALYAEGCAQALESAESLDALDAALERALRLARDAGLDARLEGCGCLLAMAALPEDMDAARELRARVLDAARTLANLPVPLSLTVHVAGRSTEGGLARLPDWVEPSGSAGVVASGAALRGLEDGLLLEPVRGREDRWRVGARG
ncbi:serine/threonine protein kinase [Corallococcus sp. H22C18031201]|uniref:serine/threonine-protein kinase n=1 Tax=Citreicoccus inhibens TaxID=2849499 RepID=UPI000E7222DC|nr:serine/threonine-protein kinase [Citreicoccus inhibens]MBU8895168.1 serine/threonine protein kinase [Citreicoccus inhibens]RJS27309.1 serine/threonine protein kinase [Corallococcus sp. H22C18031201]